jgi:hypothetical protein
MGSIPVKDAERIRTYAAALLEKAADEVSIDRAAQLLKLAFEAENQAAQAAKYSAEEQKLRDELSESRARRKSEDRKTYISILTPLFTTIVLAGTLVLQSYQFMQQRADSAVTAQRQVDLAEDQRWNDAIKVLSTNNQLSPAGSLLATFRSSPRYRDYAYDMAQQLLINSASKEEFSSVFANVFEPVSWANLTRILDSDRALYSAESPLAAKAYDAVKKISEASRLSEPERLKDDRLYAEIGQLGTKIGPLLKGARPAGISLDFHASGFWNCDWNGANLSGVDLTGTALYQTDLDGADLSGITKYEGANLFETPWWNAALISPELLKYLLHQNPHEVNERYGSALVFVSEASYETAISRLKKSSSIP